MSQVHHIGIEIAVGVQIHGNSDIISNFLGQCHVISWCASRDSSFHRRLNEVVQLEVRVKVDCLHHLDHGLVTLIQGVSCAVLQA